MVDPLKKHLFLTSFLLILLSWLSTGTLAPYATTLPIEYIRISPEGYPVNLDHQHFAQVDLMIGGYPKADWKDSHYLRRFLYSIAARPFTAVMGFFYGGVLFNILINLGALLAFYFFVRNRYSTRTSFVGLWILASYPGIYYWVGLPYHHASIVPLCLLQYFLLVKLYESTNHLRSKLFKTALLIGILGLAYDLTPIFLGVLVLLCLEMKFWKELPLVIGLAIIPGFLTTKTLSIFVNADNANSRIMGTIINSYLAPSTFSDWANNARNLPYIFINNFLDANFWALPIFFLIGIACSGALLIKRELRVALHLFMVLLGLFVFNNMAPTYEGWQMRGLWIARIYQPLFITFLFFILAFIENKLSYKNIQQQFITLLLIALVGINLLTSVGGISGFSFFSNIFYHRFYQHSPLPQYSKNIKELGRRPIGFPLKNKQIGPKTN